MIASRDQWLQVKTCCCVRAKTYRAGNQHFLDHCTAMQVVLIEFHSEVDGT